MKLKEMDVTSTDAAARRNRPPIRHWELNSRQMKRISEHRSSVDRKIGRIMVKLILRYPPVHTRTHTHIHTHTHTHTHQFIQGYIKWQRNRAYK